MIEPSPVRHHMTRRHDPVRLCDEQPADDDDIPTTDIDALRDARAEATLCPVCQQNSHIHDYSLRPDRYQDGRRTLAHLYTVPVQYAFDGIRNCPHCRENPGARTCRAWKEARKSVRVLHREARRIAKDVTDLDGVTGGCIATVYHFADGSVAYFALDAPAWREADEIAAGPWPGRSVSWRPEGFRRRGLEVAPEGASGVVPIMPVKCQLRLTRM